MCETCWPETGCYRPQNYFTYFVEEYGHVEGGSVEEQEKVIMFLLLHLLLPPFCASYLCLLFVPFERTSYSYLLLVPSARTSCSYLLLLPIPLGPTYYSSQLPL